MPKSLTAYLTRRPAGVGIDLDFGDVAAIGIGRGWRLHRQRGVQRLGFAFRQLHQADAAIRASDGEAAIGELDVGDRRLQSLAGQTLPRATTSLQAMASAFPDAIIDFILPVPPPAISASESPCSRVIRSDGMPSRSTSTCAKEEAWPCP